MSVPWPYRNGRTLTLRRQVGVQADLWGNEEPVWAETELRRCAVWQRSSAEASYGSGARTVAVTRLAAMLPPGTAVTQRDELTIDGVHYRVSSVPDVKTSSLTGLRHGVQVDLEVVSR